MSERIIDCPCCGDRHGFIVGMLTGALFVLIFAAAAGWWMYG